MLVSSRHLRFSKTLHKGHEVKGQLISECFWCFDQNSNQNIVRISALIFFVVSWGLSGSFWGLPGDLVSNIINKEAYRKPQESYKNFQGRHPYNIFVTIVVETMTPKRHLEIN